jgi:hypothetical protein
VSRGWEALFPQMVNGSIRFAAFAAIGLARGGLPTLHFHDKMRAGAGPRIRPWVPRVRADVCVESRSSFPPF